MKATKLFVLVLALAMLITLSRAAGAQGPQVLGNGGCPPGNDYDPLCDVTHDGEINVLDVERVAGRWRTTGTYTEAYWSLTGNAGTDPAANFLGTTDNVTMTLAVSNTVALRMVPTAGTPNLIGGYSGNSVGPGVYGATISGGGVSGSTNLVSDRYGTVSGGLGNHAGTADGNIFDAEYSAVGGGENNTASDSWATVGGGVDNIASGNAATVGGGGGNTASGVNATVGGGVANTAHGDWAVVSGGERNEASGEDAAVSGGFENMASGEKATVGGGWNNQAIGDHSVIAGGTRNKTLGLEASIGGGDVNTAGGGGRAATVGGGAANNASAIGSTIGGGVGNTASGEVATVPGGLDNAAGGDYSFAAGRRAKIDATHDGAFLFADSNDFDFNAAAANEFAIRATGGARIVTAIDGSGNLTALIVNCEL